MIWTPLGKVTGTRTSLALFWFSLQWMSVSSRSKMSVFLPVGSGQATSGHEGGLAVGRVAGQVESLFDVQELETLVEVHAVEVREVVSALPHERAEQPLHVVGAHAAGVGRAGVEEFLREPLGHQRGRRLGLADLGHEAVEAGLW